jgi:hypothetical protein
MKKVQLHKDFGEHKEGDIVDATPERANYWKLVGVANDVKPLELTAPEVIELIKKSESLRELNKLVPNSEERVTVIEAYNKKRLELKPEEAEAEKPKEKKEGSPVTSKKEIKEGKEKKQK